MALAPSDDVKPDYESLLQLNGRFFEAGHYASAYHVLMAALHLADEEGDASVLDRLAEAGAAQGARIDAVRPPHQLSTAQARLRGQVPIYETFRLHVESVRLRLRAAHPRERPGA